MWISRAALRRGLFNVGKTALICNAKSQGPVLQPEVREACSRGRVAGESNFEDTYPMAKKPSNHGQPITPAVVKQVRQLAKENTPTRVIGLKVGRTEAAVRGIASGNDISLKPVNQKPYNRSK
jgi:hypothetical protein